MKISIVVPIFNEEKTIAEVLAKINSAILPAGVDKEIIVIDDGSTDASLRILGQFRSDPDLKIYQNTVNTGKAKAIKLGIEKSAGEVVLIQDADLEYDPAQYTRLLKPIVEGGESVVYGSRFKGKIEGMSFLNRVANMVSNLTVNLFMHAALTDINTGYKVFRKEVFNHITLESDAFTFETEITVKLLKAHYHICEVPISYCARTKKQGKKMNWLSALKMYAGIFRYLV